MKAVQISAPGQAELISLPEPRLRSSSDVKIRVRYVAICGDDMVNFFDLRFIGSVGHEFSGEIVELGSEAIHTGLEIGDRVTGYTWKFCGQCPYCRRGMENLCVNLTQQPAMREYIVLDSRQVCKVPDAIPLQLAALSELAASSIHAVERAGIKAGDSVLVLGGGGAGLLLVQLAKLHGASSITVSEPIASKRELSRQLGADFTVDPYRENLVERGMEITDGMGYQCILDASKNESAITEAISVLARGGTFLLFSLYERRSNLTLNLPTLYSKEMTLRTSYMAPYLLDRTMALLPKLNLEVLRSDPYPLERVQEAYEMARSSRFPRVFVKIS